MSMDIQKWNFEKREYEAYEPDESWVIVLFCVDMKKKINCTNCGADIILGDAYTSLALHNHVGSGYPVCEKCYDEERKLDKEFDRD